MDIKNYKNLIYEIKNFLDDEEYKSLSIFVEENLKQNFQFKEKKTEGYISISKHDYGHFKSFSWNQDLVDKIEEKIKYLFIQKIIPNNVDIDFLVPINDILIYPKNYFKENHWDSQDNKNIKFGIVYYINSDYEGGEIVYPDVDISIKPKANTLVIHKSDLPHYTNLVQNNGIKKIMTTFLVSKDNNSEHHKI